MANSSGAPPSPTPAASDSTSTDKKKLFIALGVAGIAALGIGGFFVMRSMSGGATQAVATNSVDANAVLPEGEPGAPGSTLADGGIPPATATQISTGGNPSTLLPLSPYRRDPFQPFFIIPTPAPPAPPLPTPTPIPRPVVIPQIDPVDIPRPGGGGFGGAAPGFAVPGINGSSASEGPLVLPAVVIPRLNSTKLVPTNAFPPPRSSSGDGSGTASPSFDKRLSGVVIGNGVRAILEISGGPVPKTYVVQPGDVVEGITILNIRRYNESGTQVTRMLIRENGGERTVDLKPGPPRTSAIGGELGGEGAGGFGGAPGGFGGAPGGFGGAPGGFGGAPGGFGGAPNRFGNATGSG